jgi:uncharacterized UPF0146 family protein
MGSLYLNNQTGKVLKRNLELQKKLMDLAEQNGIKVTIEDLEGEKLKA